VMMLNLETGERKILLQGHPAGIFNVAFSPDGSLLAAGTTQTATVFIWNTRSGTVHADFKPRFRGGTYGWVQSVAFSHDGKTLAQGSADRTIHLWDVIEKKELTPSFLGHMRDVHGVAFSRDDRQLLSIGGDNTVRLWDVETRREIFTLRECSV